MKKRITAIISVLVILSMFVSFAAYGENRGDGGIPMPTLTVPDTTKHLHSYGDWVITAEPTCTKTGTKERTCTGCGITQTGVVRAKGHSFGEWTVVTAATEDAEGLEKRKCAACNYYDTRSIPRIGHVHTLKAVNATDATCTKDGNIAYYECADGEFACGRLFSDSEGLNPLNTEDVVTPMLGHDFGEWIVTTEPTAATEGEKTRYCSRCDATETEPIPVSIPDDGGDWEADGIPVNPSKESTQPSSDVITPSAADGAQEDTALPKAAKIKKLISGKKQITVKWKKVSSIKGYQLQYGLKKSFKGAKAKKVSASKTSYKIKKLKSKKTYYVRIRTYKVINGRTVYSKWSKAKKIKVK